MDLLNNKERYYIDLYNTMSRDYGYNLKSGGQDSNYVTDEVKRKISESNKNYYKEHPEAKKESSINAYNQWSNPEIKAKIMECMGKHILKKLERKFLKYKKVMCQNIEIKFQYFVLN